MIESLKSSKEDNHSFVLENPREGVVKYVFDHVEVAFDISGKNYKNLPEIGFGTFDTTSAPGSLAQPYTKREGVDMSYVVECILIAMKDAGYTKVWFYPYDTDTKESAVEAMKIKKPDITEDEIKAERELARLRLFERYAGKHIAPEPNGYGYILTL